MSKQPEERPPSQLTLAKSAGFPESILLPISPITAQPDRFPDRGKSPAYWGRYGWTNLKDWQTGLEPQVLAEADYQGCNIGVILGKPVDGYQLLFVDIDTAGDADPRSEASLLAKQIQAVALKALADASRSKRMWVRLTRPGRAGVLIMLPDEAIAGRVSTVHLTTANGVKAGAIQLLAKGQQAVIGGTHPWNNGTPIRWTLLTENTSHNKTAPYPTLTDHGIPFAEDRLAVNSALESILSDLQTKLGISASYKKHDTGSITEGTPLTPADQAPWDVKSFISLFKTMPHDDRIDYDSWKNVMLSAQGCIQSSFGVSDKDKRAMADAVINWSARWEDPTGLGTTFIDEAEKWEKDWSTRDVKHVGWESLLRTAISLGNDKLRIDWACREFPATLIPDENEKHVIPRPKAVKSIQSSRRENKIKFDVKASEIQIADAIQDEIGKKCAYVIDEKRWIAWDGPEKGWSDPRAEAIVKQEIENQLIYYVAKYGESFGDNESVRTKLTSARCVRDIETLLRSRLAITSDDINKGELIIQTPGGPWSLRTGKPLEGDEYENLINLRDTRSTRVSPVDMPTPMFDSLLDHLSCGDQAVAAWLLSYFGYALLGNPKLHHIVVLYGPGGNGKSTIAEIFMRIWGDYATSINRSVIMDSGANNHPTSLNRIRGRRLWCVAELPEKGRWNEAIIRTLSGGDPVQSRGMNENEKEFRPEGTFFIYTNFIPRFHQIDEAIIRRFRFINARMKVPEALIDRRFQDKIMAQESGGILYKLIQEGKKVLDGDWSLPKTPDGMQAEIKQHFGNQDAFQIWFMTDCQTVTLQSGYAPLSTDLLYDRYKKFAEKIHGDANGTAADANESALLTEGFDCLTMSGFIAALRRSGASIYDYTGAIQRDQYGKIMMCGIRLKALAEVAA